jgi:NADH:ubiquinone oxidoreductase subunit 2 (subunit N)
MRPLLMLPEMLLFGGGLVVLISGSFLPRQRQWWTRGIAAVVLAGVIVASVAGMAGPDQAAFEGTFAVDTATAVARIVAAIGEWRGALHQSAQPWQVARGLGVDVFPLFESQRVKVEVVSVSE